MRSKQIIIFVLITSIYGLLYYLRERKINGELKRVQDSPIDLNILQSLNIQQESIEQIQYIDQLNICIITTKTILLVWDININEVILRKQFNKYQSIGQNFIKYNIIIDEQQFNGNKNILLIIHSSQANETQFYRFQAEILSINSQEKLRINSNVEVVESLFSYSEIKVIFANLLKQLINITKIILHQLLILLNKNLVLLILQQSSLITLSFSQLIKIQVIQEMNAQLHQQTQLLPFNMYVKLTDGSIRKILYRNQRILSFPINIKNNFHFNKILLFSKDEYILQDNVNQLIQFVSEVNSEINFLRNYSIEDSIIYENGLIQNRNTKYIISSDKNNNSVSIIFFFEKEKNKYSRQIIQYEDFSYYPSSHPKQIIFLQQKSTNKIYQIKFDCLQEKCSEIDRQLIELPFKSTFIIQKEDDKHAIYLNQNPSNIFAYHQICQNSSFVFNLSDFTCIPKDQCSHKQKQLCINTFKKRILFTAEQDNIDKNNINSQNQSNIDDSDIEDPVSETIKIVEIVLGVIGAIVILVVFFCCLKRYRQKQKLRNIQKEYAQRVANEQQIQQQQQLNAQQVGQAYQPQYMQVPQVNSQLNNSNSNIQPPLLQPRTQNVSGLVEANGNPSSLTGINMNGQLISQNQQPSMNSNISLQNIPYNYQQQLLPKQNSNPQIGNNAIGINGNQRPLSSYQAPFLVPGLNNMNMMPIQNNLQIQNNMPIQNNPQMQNNLQKLNNLPIQNNLQMPYNLPIQNNMLMMNQFMNDPNSIAIQQQQIMQQQIQLQQLIAQQQNILQQQQQLQLQYPDLQNQKNAIQSNGDNINYQYNHINSKDEVKQPQSDYNKLNGNVQGNLLAQKQSRDNQMGKQNDFDTPTPNENLKFINGVSQPQNIQPQIQNQDLKETDILKKNFEQQMMMLMESGAIAPGQVGGKIKEPFIQPPILEEGQYENEENQSQKKSNMNYGIQNQQIGNTQFLKQKFEDELQRQLQGTEIFYQNKLMQQQNSQFPIQKEFPKFIPDNQEEGQQNSQKMDDGDDNFEDDIDECVESENKIKVIPRKIKANVRQQNQLQRIDSSEKLNIQSKQQIDSYNINSINNGANSNNQQNLEASNPNNFLDFMKDQLGESIGKQRNDRKFIQSVIENPGTIQPLYSEFNNIKFNEFPNHFSKIQKTQEQYIQNNDIQLELQDKNLKYQHIQDKVLGLNNNQNTDNGIIN